MITMRRLCAPRLFQMALRRPLTSLTRCDIANSGKSYFNVRPTAFFRQNYATDSGSRATEFEMSKGKIADILREDYLALFERSFDFNIYHKNVLLEVQFATVNEGRRLCAPHIQGIKAYNRAVSTLQKLAQKTVTDGKVTPILRDGSTYGHDIMIKWTCDGRIAALALPIRVDAISLYSLDAEAPFIVGTQLPLHRIKRHTMEFVEIQPPWLRSAIRGEWLGQQQLAQPALALHGKQLVSTFDLPIDVENDVQFSLNL